MCVCVLDTQNDKYKSGVYGFFVKVLIERSKEERVNGIDGPIMRRWGCF